MYVWLIFRSTVQMLMSLMDPERVKRRKGHRLKRRVYQNKVRQYNMMLLIVKSYKLHALHFRARILYGTLMGTISSSHMALLFMDALTGMSISIFTIVLSLRNADSESYLTPYLHVGTHARYCGYILVRPTMIPMSSCCII